MPYNRLKNSLSFTGSQKYFSCLLKKIGPAAIRSICKGVRRSVKGKAWVTKGNDSSLLFSKNFILRLPAFVFRENLCRKSGQALFACFSPKWDFHFFFSFIRKWDFQCIVFSVVANFSLRYYLVWIFFYECLKSSMPSIYDCLLFYVFLSLENWCFSLHCLLCCC